jgi:hypothetical protein
VGVLLSRRSVVGDGTKRKGVAGNGYQGPDSRQISPAPHRARWRARRRVLQTGLRHRGAVPLRNAERDRPSRQLRIADSVVLVSDENLQRHPEVRVGTPQTLGGSGMLLELYVDDVDAWYERAIQGGSHIQYAAGRHLLRRPLRLGHRSLSGISDRWRRSRRCSRRTRSPRG